MAPCQHLKEKNNLGMILKDRLRKRLFRREQRLGLCCFSFFDGRSLKRDRKCETPGPQTPPRADADANAGGASGRAGGRAGGRAVASGAGAGGPGGPGRLSKHFDICISSVVPYCHSCDDFC